MKLRQVKLRNFRAYADEMIVRVENLTALVGRNDVGKSTVFDALGAFLGAEGCQLDQGDRCVHARAGEECSIICVFDDLPEELVLDDAASTSLQAEWLLNDEGRLEIKKVFSGEKMKEEVLAVANHPTAGAAADLLSKKNPELKRIAQEVGAAADQRSNVALRQAIRTTVGDLRPARTEVPLSREGGKEIWAALIPSLPLFALFRADRASRDDDDEVQDPMRVAVREAIAELGPQLQAIREQVERKALAVAERTLVKLAEIDGSLASALSPRIRSDPKWDSLFKLSLTGDNEIPINKRGSGVRRLVLLAFFQAEVERRRGGQAARDIIYAIEEPETSQHPSNQVAVIEALKELAATPRTQVLITTHVPALAALLPTSGIQFVTQDGGAFGRAVQEGDGVLRRIAADLGVYPDLQDSRVQVFLCVEGPTDVEFFKAVGAILHREDARVPDIGADPRVAMLPLGGDTLKDWVNKQYLSELGRPEVHIYDGDKPGYSAACDEVNGRQDGRGSWATQTRKREIENYLHPAAIQEVLGVQVAIEDDSDVEAVLKTALGQGRVRGKRIKRILAEDVARRMTVERLRERGGLDEIRDWYLRIAGYLS